MDTFCLTYYDFWRLRSTGRGHDLRNTGRGHDLRTAGRGHDQRNTRREHDLRFMEMTLAVMRNFRIIISEIELLIN